LRPNNAFVGGSLNLISRFAPLLAGRAALGLFRLPIARAKATPHEQAVVADAQRGSITLRDKKVVTYQWGNGERPVLLVHGWRSRASRFAGFVPSLRERGYSPIAFDAPAHGESSGNATTILEYRDIISRLTCEYGTFESVVAHSFGVLASFVALSEGEGVRARRLVAISGVYEMEYLLTKFCRLLQLSPRLNRELRVRIERDMFPGEDRIWQRFSAGYRPEIVRIPLLVVHDKNDDMADVSQAERIIAAYRGKVQALITQNLEHHRTLRDASVVTTVGHFLAAEDGHTRSQPSLPAEPSTDLVLGGQP
jgi:pimeloyl-ACP methyl ester carboxylesterase